jgi:hypothetical protein
LEKLGSSTPASRQDALRGVISRRADLTKERKHVRREPRIEQHRWIDLLFFGKDGCLVQHRGQARQELNENRN